MSLEITPYLERKIDRYVLTIQGDDLALVIFGEGMPPEGKPIVRERTCTNLKGMRQYGKRMADKWGVDFVDETGLL